MIIAEYCAYKTHAVADKREKWEKKILETKRNGKLHDWMKNYYINYIRVQRMVANRKTYPIAAERHSIVVY